MFSLFKNLFKQTKDKVIPQGQNNSLRDDLVLRCPDDLEYYPFQKEDIQSFLDNGGSGLNANEQGLGKTIHALGVINQSSDAHKVLVVCPASLKINWQEEAEKWLVEKYKITIINSSKDKPELSKRYLDKEMFIINYELLKPFHKFLRTVTWNYVFYDEVHKIKNPNAQRTKEVLGCLEKNIMPINSIKKILITGTPILSKPRELWPLLRMLDWKNWNDYHAFIRRYCNRKGEVTNADELHRAIKPYMTRRKKKDVLQDLPSKIRQTIVLEGNRTVEKAIRHEQDVLVECAGQSPAIAMAKIVEARKQTALAKIPLALESIEDASEEGPVIVFAHHQDVIHSLNDGLVKSKKRVSVITGQTPQGKRNEYVKDFQARKLDVILGSIGAMGTGLTLTASSKVIFVELPWTPAELVQAEDRAHRIGQKESVLVQYLVVKNSIDQKITRILKEKTAIIHKVLDQNNQSFINNMIEFLTKGVNS